MADLVSVVVAGINGYGSGYVKKLLTHKQALLAGVVDNAPERSPYLPDLRERGVPVYHSLTSFYREHHADLAVIATPIHFHTVHALEALTNGSHVLCEKPLSAVANDFSLWEKAVREAQRWAAIGFNWSFSKTVHALKRDRMAGLFGRAKSLKTLVFWPRNTEYYQRSNWAGKRYSQQGQAIFDSIANNAAAHFLHHLLYVLGDKIDTCANVVDIDAELYRANPIETFDTCILRAKTDEGAALLFVASHATEEEAGPMFALEFEKATIEYRCTNKTGHVVAYFKDGSTKVYGRLGVTHDDSFAKLDDCIEAIIDPNRKVPCTYETAFAHVQIIEQLKQHPIHEFANVKQVDGYRVVPGLADVLLERYENPQQWPSTPIKETLKT